MVIEEILLARERWYSRSALLSSKSGRDQFFLHSAYNVPYYREHFRLSGWPPDPSDVAYFPITSKSHVVRNPKQFLASIDESAYACKSSGTSGPALKVEHDLASWYEDSHYAYRLIQERLIIPKFAEFIAKTIRNVILLTDKSTVDKAVTLLPEMNLAHFRTVHFGSLNYENDLAPVDILHGRPSMLRRTVAVHYPNIRPKLVLCGGEPLYADVRKSLREVFDCDVREIYATAECGVIAVECIKGNMHLTENRSIEVFRNGLLYNCGPGELTVTNYANWRMPFIRYRTGDFGSLLNIECECGISGICIVQLSGRDCPCGKRSSRQKSIGNALTLLGIFDFQIAVKGNKTLITFSTDCLSVELIECAKLAISASENDLEWCRVPSSFWTARKCNRYVCSDDPPGTRH